MCVARDNKKKHFFIMYANCTQYKQIKKYMLSSIINSDENGEKKYKYIY